MKRVFFFFIFILITAILTIALSPKINTGATSFIRGSSEKVSTRLAKISGDLSKTFSIFFRISQLKNDNERLANQLIGLQVDRSRIVELEAENQLLKKELGFLDQTQKGALVPARIIERDPTTFFDNIVVDKGSSDGIKEGMAVTFNGVLVGQVKEVFGQSSKILLISGRDSLIQVMLQENRSKGILRGGLSGLYIENIISDTEYREGEYVITSGLGGKMRQGILVGKAGKTEAGSPGIFKNIAVEPLIDLSTLELVFIEK